MMTVPMEEVYIIPNINHLCPTKHGYSWDTPTRWEAKWLEKKAQRVIVSEVDEMILYLIW